MARLKDRLCQIEAHGQLEREGIEGLVIGHCYRSGRVRCQRCMRIIMRVLVEMMTRITRSETMRKGMVWDVGPDF